jgi:hypothetical protein
MYLLSQQEIKFISGGLSPLGQSILDATKEYSFYFGLGGWAVSSIYALATQSTVMTISGATITLTSSFPALFWGGIGIGWSVGVLVGIGVGIYNAC